ncbi:MAG: TlpA family protein disulfide reductase [Desulfobacterales bacterium]|nr:MAG: TlpA family protein disulfide reductase [Desulfobacterales bacterium]
MTEKRINYQSITITIVIVLALLVFIALRQKDAFIKYLTPDEGAVSLPAPDFTLPGLNGRLVSLSDYRGKVVVVNVWATWCLPCVEEMPSLEKLYREFKDENFEILAVSIDSGGIAAVAPFMKTHGLTFPALIDTQASIRDSYKITGVPETFIIDKKGILVKKVIGPLDWSSPEILRYIRKLIQEPSSA